MKRLFSILSVLLSMIIVIQSVPVSALASLSATEQAELVTENTAESVENADESSVPYILGEIVEERTTDTKVFRMSDGSYTAAVYPTPVHYEEDGEMKEIDYRFEQVRSDGETYLETKRGPVTLRVPETIDEDSEVVFSTGEHSVSFTLREIGEIAAEKHEADVDTKKLEALKESVFTTANAEEKAQTASVQSADKKKEIATDEEFKETVRELSELVMTVPGASSAVSYESVMDGIDLNYRVSGTALKEEIILNRQASALKTFSFVLDAGDLTAILNSDNSVSLKDKDGEEQMHIASPFMVDAIGAESTDIIVSLEENEDGTYTYTLEPDKEWLSSAERVYPVTIDPPVLVDQSTSVMDTTAIFATSVGSLNEGSEYAYLKVGKRSTAEAEVIALVQSNLPSVLDSTTNIINAYMYLYSYSGNASYCSTDMQINAYRITKSWNSDSTAIAMGNTNYADYQNVLDYVYFNDAAKINNVPYRFDITEAVHTWITGADNYGIALKAASTPSENKFARFHDSSGSAGSNGYSPAFVYEYRDSGGIEDYWSFTSMDAGRNGVAGVNNNNGNFVTVHNVVSSTGNNMPVNVSLIYSANSKNSLTNGLGAWRTNYHMRIDACDQTFVFGNQTIEYKYFLTDSDGTKHYLKKDGDEHRDEDGLGLTMTVVSTDNYKYKMVAKDHTEYYFDYFGRLAKIVDSNGNYNKLTFSSYSESNNHKITKIIEGTDMADTVRQTVFEYLDNGNVEITIPEGSFAILNYVSAANKTLSSIIYEDSKSTVFSTTDVEGTRLVTSVSAPTGLKTTVSYNSKTKRVASISRGNGTTNLKKYTFTYKHNATDVTDKSGRVTTLQFNNYGHTVGTVNQKAFIGQNYEFGAPGGVGTETGTENKLLTASKPISASGNRMTDGGFNAQGGVAAYSFSSSDDSTSGISKTYTTDIGGNTGSGCMAVTKNSTNASKFVYQSIQGVTEGKFTLSAYVSTNGETLNGKGIQLSMNLFVGSNYRTTVTSDKVTHTKQGEWRRIQVTADLPASDTGINAGILFPEDTSGTVYVDDIQLEYNLTGGAGNFNQLQNPTLINSAEGWENLEGFTVSSVTDSKPSGIFRAATVTGSASAQKKLRQILPLSGNAGDVFIAGAWAKANSVPSKGTSQNKKGTPEYGMRVTFYNGSDIVGSIIKIPFNSTYEGWQYTSAKVIAPAAYTKVYVTFAYNYNTGSASVACPFLYKESYGQSYVYDANGNVVSAEDAAETEATFAYQNDVLCENLSPTGSRYMYANTDTTYNTTYALSNAGQKISFGYNQSGDATSLTVENVKYITSSTDLGNKNCFIVNAKDGRALKPIELTNSSVVYASNLYINDSNVVWQAKYLSSSIFYFKNMGDDTKALAVNEGGVGTTLKTPTYTNSVPPDAFKLKVVANGDGTFKLLTGESGYQKALYRTDNTHYEGSNRYKISSGANNADDPAYKWYFISADADYSGNLRMTTGAEYDTDGTHLISSTDTLGNKTSYSYGTNRLVSKVLDPMGYATNYTYDVLERTKTVSSPINDSVAKVEYDYENDLLMSIRVNNSAVKYDFTYDGFARKKAVKVGNGTDAFTLASYTYYDNGLLARQYYGTTNSDTFIGYIYDDLDRVSKKRYNALDEASAEYFYDPNGNLFKVFDNMWNKTTQYEYDLAGRVVGTATIGNTVKFARAYEGISYNDGKGTIDSYYHKMIAANGDVLRTTNYTFTYGNAASGQIPDAVYTMVAGGKDFYFQYDGLGRLKKRTLNLNGDNDGVEEYTYKANGAKTSTVVASKRDFTGYLHTYTYNKNGNIKTETVGSNVREYTYDSLNRLVEYSDPVANISETYEYDARGNITKVHTGAYNSTTQSTITYTYGNTTYKDRLTNYNGQALSYGTLGNPTVWANGKSMTWQYGRNLITVGDNITYAYNADGLRISKSGARNTEYYIVDGKYIGEVTTISGTDYTIAYVYDETDSVIGINVNGNPYYFAKNLQGDVLAILNYQGSVVARYTYDVWGKLIAVKNNDGAAITSNTHIAHLNPFRYRGYMYDKETGFYYLRSRYYDPEVGRFLNADGLVSTGQGLSGFNMFAYCGNNPVMYVDDNGNCPADFMGPCPGVDKCGYYLNNSNETTEKDILGPMVNALSISSDIILGSAEAYSKNQTLQSNVLIDRNRIVFLPKPGLELQKYPGLYNITKKASFSVSVATTSWDLVDTWTAQSNNTIRQRCIKSATIVGGTAAGIGVGAIATTAVATCITGGWGFIPCFLVYSGITVTGGMAINQIQESIYNWCDIE